MTRPTMPELRDRDGIVIGWWGSTFDREGKLIRVCIPRRDEDVAADRARARS